MFENSVWIAPRVSSQIECPMFKQSWKCQKHVIRGTLMLTAVGTYSAILNGQKVGNNVLAPGWTEYTTRLQYQIYDITDLLEANNILCVTVGRGWARSGMPGGIDNQSRECRMQQRPALIAQIQIYYDDCTQQCIQSDQSWQVVQANVKFSDIYDGEIYDARIVPRHWQHVEEVSLPIDNLIVQEGEQILEVERVTARRVFRAPNGEIIIDFGQEVSGYVEFHIRAHSGEVIRFDHAEVLDQNGNFYHDNYRTAKASVEYICDNGDQTWHPQLTYFGFRYVRLLKFPIEPNRGMFCAIVIQSELKQTGGIVTSNQQVNRLWHNVTWSQRGNFIDVPTDCPQRDERLGWTGDVLAFIKTATYNFDVKRFFSKWLRDVAVAQFENGAVPNVVPDYLQDGEISAAWGDVATIAPWQLYKSYGDRALLEEHFPMMCRWVDYITNQTTSQGLWTGGHHFSDWLGLDAKVGDYRGASRQDFIATAYYYHSTQLVVSAGHVLNLDVSKYEKLAAQISSNFKKTFTTFVTQTECVLTLAFGLSDEIKDVLNQLVKLIRDNGDAMQTGFVGTPLLLPVLSANGRSDIAYQLLLRSAYPSWLYSVTHDATTVWEHWDGIREDGTFWSTEMNSFNHYAYGSVMGWFYEYALGIQPKSPGFQTVRIVPNPDERIGWAEGYLETAYGRISVRWELIDRQWRFEIETPVAGSFQFGKQKYALSPGRYLFWS